MSKGPKCGNTKHRPMWGECTKCGDRFPCPRDCEHEDCAAAREACCEVGFRFAEETGLPPHEHPGECK